VIAHISQKDSHGCAVACMAMVSGHSYDYVRDFYSAKDFSKAGLTHFDYVEFFVEHGISINWKWPGYQAKGLNKKRDPWPCKLWAEINIVKVMTLAQTSHAIVVLKDGTVFDPLDPLIPTLSAYKEITQIIGIYK